MSVKLYFKRTVYYFGSGLELLSAFSVAVVCHDLRVLLCLKFPLSINLTCLKLILWSSPHFTNLAPKTVRTRNFINEISL